MISNITRAIMLNACRGLLAKPLFNTAARPYASYIGKLTWASASFAVLADLALIIYGGRLKFKEKITGRYADILSWMYLATATLKRFQAEGCRTDHAPNFHWAMRYSLYRMQIGFEGIFANFEGPWLLKVLLRGPALAWLRLNPLSGYPDDNLGHQMMLGLLQPGELRDSLSDGIYVPTDQNEALGRYEQALDSIIAAQPIYKKISVAIKQHTLTKDYPKLFDQAFALGLINEQELTSVQQAEAIQVDSYTLEEYKATTPADDFLLGEERTAEMID